MDWGRAESDQQHLPGGMYRLMYVCVVSPSACRDCGAWGRWLWATAHGDGPVVRWTQRTSSAGHFGGPSVGPVPRICLRRFLPWVFQVADSAPEPSFPPVLSLAVAPVSFHAWENTVSLNVLTPGRVPVPFQEARPAPRRLAAAAHHLPGQALPLLCQKSIALVNTVTSVKSLHLWTVAS